MINLTLVINIGAVLSAGTAVWTVAQYPIVALLLAFACGVAVSLSSRYAFGVASEKS